MASLTDNQLKALIYNAVGRASETQTIPFNVLIVSTGNSGYSIGALQTDFGANKSAGQDLITRYQAWASPNARLTPQHLIHHKAQPRRIMRSVTRGVRARSNINSVSSERRWKRWLNR